MSEVSQLERHLDALKKHAEIGNAIVRLTANPDWKLVIEDLFCTQECARYAQQSADPALSAENKADALAIAQAAGHLRRFLSVQVMMANQADRDIINTEEALAEARAEIE